MGSIYRFSYPTVPVIPTPSVGTPDSLCISIAIYNASWDSFAMSPRMHNSPYFSASF